MVCYNLVPFVSERKYLLITVILFLLFLCNTETRAQVGEIFSRSEGEERFGKITERAEMSTASLENILKTADDYLMFGINEGKIVVADRNRSAVYPGNFMLSSDKVMTIYSTSRIAELIARAGQHCFRLSKERGRLPSGAVNIFWRSACPVLLIV